MSADPEAYYNPEAEPVAISDYIDLTADLRKATDTKHEAQAQKQTMHLRQQAHTIRQTLPTISSLQ